MSHELRTPLNSLLILAGELEDNSEGNLSDDQVQYASTIRAAGNDLLELLNDVLDLAKVESGKVGLSVSELPLPELEQSLRREFEPVAAKQGLSLKIDLAPGLPASITTDASRLRQVLKNLISNALKFTEQGSVEVTVGPADAGWDSANESLRQAPLVIAFTVTDTGIGIAADKQEIVFEAFAQADGSASRQNGGTGLGLSISREFVQLLGGEIALKSAVGKGSTFTVYLPTGIEDSSDLQSPDGNDDNEATALIGAPVPAAPGPRPAEMPEAPPPPEESQTESRLEPVSTVDHEPIARPTTPAGASLAGMTVLVIDDDFRNIFALSSLLKRVEVAVVSAESGEKGIEALGKNLDINLVLVDIMMPIMDGYATMRAIREMPDLRDIPLVAFTAKVEAGERERCISAGASSYVSKPVDTAQLLAVLGEWLPGQVTADGRRA